jgi:hypothetical protein
MSALVQERIIAGGRIRRSRETGCHGLTSVPPVSGWLTPVVSG